MPQKQCETRRGHRAAGPLAADATGLRVGLGTDSAVSNNTLDLWEEMRFALLLQRAAREDVEAVTARHVLRLATLGGAEAMGWTRTIGSLTPGKRADLIAVRLDAPHAVPATDPYAALVYAARADDVVLTVCDGEVLYDVRRTGRRWTLPAILSCRPRQTVAGETGAGDEPPRRTKSRMASKTRAAKAGADGDKAGGHGRRRRDRIVTFLVGAADHRLPVLHEPDPSPLKPTGSSTRACACGSRW